MPMAGDKYAPFIDSTRAVAINAPKPEVWKWINSLGADRAGFFSYEFIETALGYEGEAPGGAHLEFKEFKAGDVVRGSVDPSKSAIVFEFPVLYVDPGNAFVLENWGTFQLREINERRTRLVVRTRGFERAAPWLSIADYIISPLHFLMERRMLIGIKDRVEHGRDGELSPLSDLAWFLGVFMSMAGILIIIFTARGIAALIIPLILGVLWLFTLLALPARPGYGGGLLAGIVVLLVLSVKSNLKKGRKRL